jgi:D-serine dehydratase
MLPFMDGCYTVEDGRLSSLLATLWDTEDIRLEPSALAGMYGPVSQGIARGTVPHGVHIAWATGGSMVPAEEVKKYYDAGVEQRKIY